MKPTKDQPINDESLLMIYYQQAKPQEIDACLSQTNSRNQLKQLEADMKRIEDGQQQHVAQHQLPEDYGQQLWNQIADQLVAEQSKRPKQHGGWLQGIKNSLLVPKYSMASLAMVLGLMLVAFYAGRQQHMAESGAQLQEQLLAQNIQLHLTQSEIFLTQVSHGNTNDNSQATAQRLLSSNRIFKQALAHHNGQFTHQLLQELEPILLEYANDSIGFPANKNHGQQPQANWVSDSKSNDLMFQIKVMKHQLAQKNDII